MNQAQRDAELDRIERERDEIARLFAEGELTGDGYRARLQALSGRAMRLMIEVRKARSRRSGEE